MSISGIPSSFNSSAVQQFQQAAQQRRQDFNNLAQALQSGDLSGAQQAFSDLQQLRQSSSSNLSSATQPSNQSTNVIAQDFTALGDALKSGDLSQAQSAFAKLGQDLKAAQGGSGHTHGAHHGHHAHRSNDGDADDGGAGSGAGTATGTLPVSSSGSINLLG